MTLDIRPFWLIGAIAAGGLGLLVLIVRKAYPDYLGRVLLLWGVANTCLGVSYVVWLVQSWTGQFVFDAVGCMLLAASLSLEYCAIRKLKQQPLPVVWITVPPILAFVSSIWFNFVQRNMTEELLVLNLIDMAMMFLIARSLTRQEGRRRPFPDLVAASIYALFGCITCGVIIDFFVEGHFSSDYNFNNQRTVINAVAWITAEGIIFPVFLLMLSERLNRDLLIKAMHDPLTSLYNRRAFEDIAFREIAGAARSETRLSLLMFDIDHFKQFNDVYGHAKGDAVLIAVAKTLRVGLRNEDFLCRWGGDEFCALLPRADREQAQAVAGRVIQAFEKLEFSIDGKPMEIRVSIGVVTNDGSLKDLSLLIQKADVALYRAKAGGRAGFAIAPVAAPKPDPTRISPLPGVPLQNDSHPSGG